MRETRGMISPLHLEPGTAAPPSPWRWRRALPWVALVMLLVVAQSLLVGLSLKYEASREQDASDSAAADAGSAIKHTFGRDLQDLQALTWTDVSESPWQVQSLELLRTRREVLRVEMRDASQAVTEAV